MHFFPKQIIAFLLLAFVLQQNAKAQILTESMLPIVVIETEDEEDEIPDEPKILGFMGIIDNGPGEMNSIDDPFTDYDGMIGIETRGNSTMLFDKKTYTVETWETEEVDISVPLLGMGSEEDWILHAMVIDKSLLRIPMTFDFARAMGQYAANYRFVELVLNGEYMGLYILTEKIKRDNDRVDIAKMNEFDIVGDEVTGGYILRIDWLWDTDEEDLMVSEYPSMGLDEMHYQYYYPKTENIQPEQQAYIKGFMDDFEDAVFSDDYKNEEGFRYTDYIDEDAFADFIILNELSKNSDGYKLSSYIHKERDSDGGELRAGPIWDFDQTYGMSYVCSCQIPEGWTYLQEQEWCGDLESMPLWWEAMMEDELFVNHLACRWETFREGVLHQDSIFAWIDHHVEWLQPAIDRNFEVWDYFLGENIWIQPEPIPETHAEEVQYMKDWIIERLAWLDENMPGNCEEDVFSNIADENRLPTYKVYPNPASEIAYVYGPNNTEVALFDLTGALLYEGCIDEQYFTSIPLAQLQLSAGQYILHLNKDGESITKSLVIQ